MGLLPILKFDSQNSHFRDSMSPSSIIIIKGKFDCYRFQCIKVRITVVVLPDLIFNEMF